MKKNKKIVFVSGDFNILHPGHLRLLKFAKENGDYLVVGINSDAISSNKGISEDIRLESIQATNYIDEAFILNTLPLEYIKEYKPDIVVKGSEHEKHSNLELEIIKSYGGKLLFSSGDIKFSSLTLLENEFKNIELSTTKKPLKYINRNGINLDDILKILDKFKDLNILVIGDTIIDEYITCEPLGMSQEDPTIVVSPVSSDLFLGGAGIVAAHTCGLKANVDFFSIVGDDSYTAYVNEKLKEYKVNSFLYQDKSRPTTLKQRFRANGKTLLRVNHLKQHHISIDIQNNILRDIQKCIKNRDLVVFSDFSYGCLPQRLIDKISELCLKNGVMMVADSQSSSQIGDISKFKNMTLITPTEKEARGSVADFESGLIVLAKKLRQITNSKHIFITLGFEGVIIDNDKDEKIVTDQIAALNSNPKDVAGAGDSLLIASSLALATNATIMQAAYIGSIAAALQVARVGNTPLQIEEIKKEIRLNLS